ncbi:MAG: aldehyde dehydrogenase family protein, partial [Oscillospiraceae bacterium]|nr:aldehyde dehydrogenase family protein [Oscillospiraceae bacterium]
MDIKLEKMYGLFINGEFVPAQSGRTFKTCNPATGEVLAQIAMASADDVDCAVKAAWAAFS